MPTSCYVRRVDLPGPGGAAYNRRPPHLYMRDTTHTQFSFRVTCFIPYRRRTNTKDHRNDCLRMSTLGLPAALCIHHSLICSYASPLLSAFPTSRRWRLLRPGTALSRGSSSQFTAFHRRNKRGTVQCSCWPTLFYSPRQVQIMRSNDANQIHCGLSDTISHCIHHTLLHRCAPLMPSCELLNHR